MTVAASNRLQSKLDLSKGKPPVDKKDPRIQQMQEWLRGKGWVKRAIVFDALGIKEDRIGRELKRLSHGRIMSNSAKGYKLTMEATDSEIEAAIQESLDRIDSETEYVDSIRRIARKRGLSSAIAGTYDEPLDDAADEFLCQKILAYEPEHRAVVLTEWQKRYQENVGFPSISPQYAYAQKINSCRVRVLRLIELQAGCSRGSVSRASEAA